MEWYSDIKEEVDHWKAIQDIFIPKIKKKKKKKQVVK